MPDIVFNAVSYTHLYAFESGDVHDKYMEEVKRHFKPEFINRIDEIIVFNALDCLLYTSCRMELLEQECFWHIHLC